MKINSADWTGVEKSTVKIILDTGEQLCVPANVDNRHWVEVQEWVDGGGVIADHVVVAMDDDTFFQRTDNTMGRIAEDAMVLLLQKEVIAKSDMPDAMWTKINARRVKRGLSEV